MSELHIETGEFFEQLTYGLSLRFKETWRHKYGTHLIDSFQEALLRALETQRPIKKEQFVDRMVKKNKYNENVVLDFFNDIDIGLYRPIIR